MKIISTKKITIDSLKNFNGDDLNVAKRNLREPILNAFDIYKSNVYYGVVTETIEEHNMILAWYQDLLDLKESALLYLPNKVKKYLRG